MPPQSDLEKLRGRSSKEEHIEILWCVCENCEVGDEETRSHKNLLGQLSRIGPTTATIVDDSCSQGQSLTRSFETVDMPTCRNFPLWLPTSGCRSHSLQELRLAASQGTQPEWDRDIWDGQARTRDCSEKFPKQSLRFSAMAAMMYCAVNVTCRQDSCSADCFRGYHPPQRDLADVVQLHEQDMWSMTVDSSSR